MRLLIPVDGINTVSYAQQIINSLEENLLYVISGFINSIDLIIDLRQALSIHLYRDPDKRDKIMRSRRTPKVSFPNEAQLAKLTCLMRP